MEFTNTRVGDTTIQTTTYDFGSDWED